jgi:hypothetical protein
MRSMIFGCGVIALVAVVACTQPSGPEQSPGDEPATVAMLARQRSPVPATVPDSVGIPPSIPPIVEEAPAGFEGAP